MKSLRLNIESIRIPDSCVPAQRDENVARDDSCREKIGLNPEGLVHESRSDVGPVELREGVDIGKISDFE